MAKEKIPVADPSVVSTAIVISVDDGLLSITGSSAGPSYSSTLYDAYPKLTVAAIQIKIWPIAV